MTEAEWLVCEDPQPTLEFARRRVSRRKCRLFACACCRRAPDADTHDHGEAAIGLAERLADGLETNATRARALQELWAASPYGELSFEELMAMPTLHQYLPPICRCALESNPVTAARDAAYWVSCNSGAERAALCSLLRDIFGNPFRPVEFSPAWRTDTVVQLAKQMYESREFGAMPILADALQDAGCDSDEVLNHCRGAGPHVRGCWVVDLVLGKE
jgi:hypothetical protein